MASVKQQPLRGLFLFDPGNETRSQQQCKRLNGVRNSSFSVLVADENTMVIILCPRRVMHLVLSRTVPLNSIQCQNLKKHRVLAIRWVKKQPQPTIITEMALIGVRARYNILSSVMTLS